MSGSSIVHYDKLLKLLHGPAKSERHLDVLNKLIRIYASNSLTEEDIEALPRVIRAVQEKYSESQVFEAVADQLFDISCAFLLNQKQIDSQKNREILEELGYFVKPHFLERTSGLFIKVWSLQPEKVWFAKSSIILKHLVQLAISAVSENNQDLFLYFLLEISVFPDFHQNCTQALPVMVKGLVPLRESKTLKFLDLLHTVTSSTSANEAKVILEKPECLENLLKLTNEFAKSHVKLVDKFVRNDFFLLQIQLFKLIDHVTLKQQADLGDRFLQLALDSISFLDLKDEQDEDFIEIVLLLCICCAENRVFSNEKLLKVIDGWFESLDQLPSRIANVSIQSFMQIISMVFEELGSFISTEDYFEKTIKLGKKYSGDGLVHLVPVISLMISTNHKLRENCSRFNLFQLLQEILENSVNSSKIRIDCYLLLSNICENNQHLKSIVSDQILGVLLRDLSFESGNSVEKSNFLIAVVHSIWTLICQTDENEHKFMDAHGVFKLLELLVSNKNSKLQSHILGCLIDLMDNTRAIKHVLCWKNSSNSSTIATILVKMWKREEKLLNSNLDLILVPRNENGLIEIVGRPLDEREILTETTPDPIVEVATNLRIKIYLFMLKIGFEQMKELANLTEKITISMIERYHDFKIGEIWDRISYDIKTKGVRPTTPDMALIDVVRKTTVNKSNIVLDQQKELFETIQEIESAQEQGFYQEISHRLPSLLNSFKLNSQ